MNHSYSLVPFDSVPATPPYRAWFALWSADRSQLTWTEQRPSVPPDSSSAWVVCVTAEAPPSGAVLLTTGTKDVPPPPLAAVDVDRDGFELAFQAAFQLAGTPKSWSAIDRVA